MSVLNPGLNVQQHSNPKQSHSNPALECLCLRAFLGEIMVTMKPMSCCSSSTASLASLASATQPVTSSSSSLGMKGPFSVTKRHWSSPLRRLLTVTAVSSSTRMAFSTPNGRTRAERRTAVWKGKQLTNLLQPLQTNQPTDPTNAPAQPTNGGL